MQDILQFLSKVFLGSTIAAAVIKYLPILSQVPANSGIALAIVLSPVLALAGILAWRSRQSAS